MSAVSVFRFSVLKHKKKYFVVDNPNTKTADKVCNFRTWIIDSETRKKMRFAADNPNKKKLRTMSAVSVFGFSVLKQQKNAFCN